MCRATKFLYYATILGFLGLLPLPKGQTGELTVPETLDLLDGSLQAIKSFDIVGTATVRQFIDAKMEEQSVNGRRRAVVTEKHKLGPNEKSPTLQLRIHQIFQRGKGRIDFFDGSGHSAGDCLVYDGELEKTWHPKSRTASIGQPGLTPAGMDGTDYRECYLSVVGSVRWMKSLRERQNVKVNRDADGSLLILESDPDPKAKIDLPQWGLRLTIDLRHGFMPVVLETLKKIDGKNQTQVRRRITNWKDLGGGVWAPTRMVSETFDLDPKFPQTFGEVWAETVFQVDVSSSSWNQAIPETVFELPLPAGAVVTDLRRNVRYVTGKPDPGKNLDDLAANARDLVPVSTRAVTLPSKPWPLWVLIGGPISVLLLVGLMFVTLRHRRRLSRGT